MVIEAAAEPTYVLVGGTIFPPEGGDTRVTVHASSQAPLVVTTAPGMTARFEGRTPIAEIMDGGWSVWKTGPRGGNIYWAKLRSPVWQLWLGDDAMTVARYPDVGSDWFHPWPKTWPLTLTAARGSEPGGWARGQGMSTPFNSSYDDFAYGSRSSGYWGGWFKTDGGDRSKDIAGVGARRQAQWDYGAKVGSLADSKLEGYNFEGGILHSRMCGKTEFWHPLVITEHRGNTIRFRADVPGKLWKGPDDCRKSLRYPEKFYIEAKDALNLPMEWWYETGTQKLFVYLPGGAQPDGAKLMGKVNDIALDFQASSNVQLRGLSFFGTFASAGTGGGGSITSCDFRFPNYPRIILGEFHYTQKQMYVKNQRFEDNDVRYFSSGMGFSGPLVEVENNLLEHGIYGCGPMGCGAMFVTGATAPRVRRNTIRYTQQWHGIVWLTKGFEGAYNHLHDVCTVRDDASNFQTKFSGEEKSHIHHNWAYNSELKGVRFDTCGGRGDSGYPECGGAVWNNVFMNSHQGANIKGDYQMVVGNTAFANGQRTDLTVSPAGVGGTEDGFVYNKFSHTYNNAADRLSRSDSRCYSDLPGQSGRNYISGCPQDSSQARTPLAQALRDPYNFDFRPVDRPWPQGLVGGAQNNIPQFEAIDGSKVELRQGNDLGAYQSTDTVYWIPGKMFAHASTPVPPHTATQARNDLDLMFLAGKDAVRHLAYLSPDPCLVAQAGQGNDAELIATLSAPSNIVPRSSLGNLQAQKWYYWRVDAEARDGSVSRGPVWCFAVGGTGSGGCTKPPCGDWQATVGTPCASDSGHAEPKVPECSR